MAKKKQNWKIIKDQEYLDTAQGRDVYNEQQLERGKLQDKQTFFVRGLLCVLAGVFTGIIVYAGWGIVAENLGTYQSEYQKTINQQPPIIDEDGDGIPDDAVDLDGDGVPDADLNGDGIPDEPNTSVWEDDHSDAYNWITHEDYDYGDGGDPHHVDPLNGKVLDDNNRLIVAEDGVPVVDREKLIPFVPLTKGIFTDYWLPSTVEDAKANNHVDAIVYTNAEGNGMAVAMLTSSKGEILATAEYDVHTVVNNSGVINSVYYTDLEGNVIRHIQYDKRVISQIDTYTYRTSKTQPIEDAIDETEADPESETEVAEEETAKAEEPVESEGEEVVDEPETDAFKPNTDNVRIISTETFTNAGNAPIINRMEYYYENGVVQRANVYNESGVLNFAGNYENDEIHSMPTVDYYNGAGIVIHQEAYIKPEGATKETPSIRVSDTYYYPGGTRVELYDETGKHYQDDYYDLKGELLGSEPVYGFWHPKAESQLLWSIVAGFLVTAALWPIMKRNLEAQNMLANTDDINQYTNDQHIALPEEIQKKYNFAPDAGAHTSVLSSSMLSHNMLKNKGINTIKVSKRYEKDVKDTDGNVIYYKGDIIRDENGDPIFEEKPMFDEDFADALFEASGAPKEVRFSYDPSKISYNPDNYDREKLTGKEPSTSLVDKILHKLFKREIPMVSKYDYLSDLINKDWEFPEYEPQRPAGVYVVDTAPVNTMVLAITRAGKGQTYIEPMIDIWTREKRGNNMVINDPKGELLVKFYTRGTFRGYQIVQFNLINAMKTDIYNPLGMAAQSAREGDFTKCAMYVENVAEVFFPLDGGDDPVWPNAANNAFKRAAYGLIDYYLEEERKYRNECNMAIQKGKYIDPQVIETNIDQMWGKVTLYNCYQMFTQLTSKKLPNPAKEFAQKMKNGGFEGVPEEEVAAEAEKANALSDLWAGAPEADCLTLYFNATEKLPNNSMRTLVSNVNNALKSMAGAEKMMASVYGIAITAMSFFTDPTISTLTSGTPSQTVDLAGYSFPRRFGVRFHPDYITRNHYVGLQCKWDAFEDKEFKKPLDAKLFEHKDIVSREGWARYYFDGKFDKNIAYVRLRLMNASTGVLVHTYYFEFRKDYQTSLDGKTYIKDPILGTKIAKNGSIAELLPQPDGSFKPGSTTFTRKHLEPIEDSSRTVNYKLVDETVPCITQNYVRYAEKPKMTFLVTPPHLMKYAKLILILVKQLFDLNVDQSYMTKDTQKPLYKTRYMLDELGNLQSEGHGISGFETMLSIGLGQEQQYTLILQTLQQLKDVYGDSVDKIVQGNTSNIVFLKSTDDSMLETLEKMSGKTHKSYIDQKTVTRDMEKLVMANEGKASYMMQTKEVPVISYNDMAFIKERNSIVFRAGDSPIWNRNETILPMSWRLFSNTIEVPGTKYTLQTIPTLSSAVDFDLKKNQPDFEELLKVRMEQATRVDAAIASYKSSYAYDDDDIHRLDIDVYAADIMDMINTQIERELNHSGDDDAAFDDSFFDADDSWFTPVENEEVKQAVSEVGAERAENDKKVYANGMISKSDLVSRTGLATHMFDQQIIEIYKSIRHAMNNDPNCMGANGCLCSKDGAVIYIEKVSSADAEKLREASEDPESSVYTDEPLTDDDVENLASWSVSDEFYRFLASLPNWKMFAGGKFEEEMYRRLMG